MSTCYPPWCRHFRHCTAVPLTDMKPLDCEYCSRRSRGTHPKKHCLLSWGKTAGRYWKALLCRFPSSTPNQNLSRYIYSGRGSYSNASDSALSLECAIYHVAHVDLVELLRELRRTPKYEVSVFGTR